ncbi:hypothetical protein SAMN05660662_3712 [Blastococcus aurantiacus]|uniref:Uncharacterized protein n=1 Tax=Blastococcus aurantiacus TaxID=1550231 RepID=A0A1G7PSH1_9ACTN|nr:hypothetical protein [Blastococcus aurantiacus]SDF89282.1 hypothetical protein SAMN05660662_3712 [Blastococcus aurantiacus]
MAATQDGPELHPVTRELAEGPDYTVISTLLPDGNIESERIIVRIEAERQTILE